MPRNQLIRNPETGEAEVRTNQNKDRLEARARREAKEAIHRVLGDNRNLPLMDSHRRFAEKYVETLDVVESARASGSSDTANAAAIRMRTPEIQLEIGRLMEERSQRTQITVDMVLQRLWLLATADPNELIEHRRICCRYCHGKDNKRQRTPSEMDRDRRSAEFAGNDFDEQGGDGYDPRKNPNPDCGECFGQGVNVTFPKDTRNLSPAGQALYAGVKVTKEGLEIKMHDQVAALIQVGKHLGMFSDRLELTRHQDGKVIVKILGPNQSMDDL